MNWEEPLNPFEALGLERDATPKTIKARYRELAFKYHPDRGQGSEDAKAALSKHFNNVQQAWQLLAKPERRRRRIELLDLLDLEEDVLASVADLLVLNEESGTNHDHEATVDGHVSSDADEDLPRVAGIKRRTTFDRPTQRTSGLGDIAEHGDLDALSGAGTQQASRRISQLRNAVGASKDDDSSDTNTTAERRKQFDKLRKKELDAFTEYKDAMAHRFEAERAAEKYKERFEQARWRRKYFERAPRDTSQRVKMLKLINKATKAFATQRPVRSRNRSTVSYPGQILSTGDPSPIESTNFLTLPSRIKSIRRRGWTSDISGDQTSSDENDHSSDKNSSPSRSPRPSSPRPSSRRHRRYDSLPTVASVSVPSLPNGNHDPISPITGPGPRVFVRTATSLNEVLDVQRSEVSSASSRSPSPSTALIRSDQSQFVLVRSTRASSVSKINQDRRSPSAERHAGPLNGAASRPHSPPSHVCHFSVQHVGRLHHHSIPTEHVHTLTDTEKQWMLSVEADEEVRTLMCKSLPYGQHRSYLSLLAAV